MVCAMHRLFQKEEDDRIMEGDFDPMEERMKQAQSEGQAEEPGWLSRLITARRFSFRRNRGGGLEGIGCRKK